MMEAKKGMKKRRGMMVGRRLEPKGKAASLEGSQALLFPLHLYRYPPAALEMMCKILNIFLCFIKGIGSGHVPLLREG